MNDFASNSEVILAPYFDIYRKDYEYKGDGGVIICVNNNWEIDVSSYLLVNCDILFIEVNVHDVKSVLLECNKRPHKNSLILQAHSLLEYEANLLA